MRSLRKNSFIAVISASLVYAFSYGFLDRPIAVWVRNNLLDTWAYQAGKFVSAFADGSMLQLALALTLILLWLFGKKIGAAPRNTLLYICVALSIAIVVAEGLKYLLARYRPVMLFDQGLYGFHFFSKEWAINSTPSGHTTRAFAFFTALSVRFRRLTAPFVGVACLIGISRVAVTDHYLGDVVFGALLGTLAALWTYTCFFDHDEEGPAEPHRPSKHGSRRPSRFAPSP